LCCILDLTFPNYHHIPASVKEILNLLFIPDNIPVQFFTPVGFMGFRDTADFTGGIVMLMPETAMDEDDFFHAWKNDIRLAWQISPVKPVAVAHAVDQAAHCHFGLHSLAADAPHVITAAFFTDCIHCY